MFVIAIANHGSGGCVWKREFVFQAVLARHRLRITAEQNVCSAASHVRRNGHRAFAARLRDDLRFALVLLGVQYLVGNARFLELLGDLFRFLD